ncbi:transposase domain-containing protein, partial [Rhizobium leguminosarum]
LIETCKLNAIDPFAYVSSTLTAIVNGHKQSGIEGLLPWNHRPLRWRNIGGRRSAAFD